MPKKILLIDDEEILTKTFNKLLQKGGYDVFTSKNTLDASVLLEEEPFDLVISDIRMPGENGVSTLKKVRSGQGINSKTPIIFMTGFADSQVEAEAKALKPIAYLHKPFDNLEILSTIERTIGK